MTLILFVLFILFVHISKVVYYKVSYKLVIVAE